MIKQKEEREKKESKKIIFCMRAREVSFCANNTSKRDRKGNKRVNVITVTDRKLNEVEIEASDFARRYKYYDYICIKKCV